MPRVMEIATPLGPDVLLFKTLKTTEALGQLYHYTITTFSLQSDIDPNSIVGKPVTVNLELPDGGTRYFNGYVTSFSWIGMEGRYHKYKLIVHPWLQFLSYTADCRIFQNLTVVDIIKEIFNDYPQAMFELQLTESYHSREYCVQYRETDFNFISRLMEEEGIYYYFKHEAGSHTLVLADSISAHDVYTNYKSLPFIPQQSQRRPEQERISEWDFTQAIQTGRVVIDHYDFKKPSVELQSRSGIKREHAYEDYECYDYPACYVDRGVGEKFARIRVEEQQANFQSVSGHSNARGLSVGYLFTLTNHPRNDQNCEYLVRETIHELDYGSYETSDKAPNYECTFKLIQSKQPYRSTRIAQKTRVQGPQTAVVVGPSGDEIYTDSFGRIKVQFHWDREGKKDEQSSCWIRVSHPWAGKGWGMVAIPRIGQEVIVDFLEGDPDQPVVTGRLYNAEQMPPYALPGNMTQSGILSRSSKTGNSANANEFRFEDKKGEEQVYLHAEKNQDIEVENDETHWVGKDRSKTIDHDETVHVKHDRTETVDNNETITIGVNRTEQVGNNETITIGVNRTETVGSNETISIGANRTESVADNETVNIGANKTQSIAIAYTQNVGAAKMTNVGGAYLINVGAAMNRLIGLASAEEVGLAKTTSVGMSHSLSVGKDQSIEIGDDQSVTVGKNIKITAGDSIELICGKSRLRMDKDGNISINGHQIDLGATGEQFYKADGNITIKAKKILEN